MVPVRGYAIKVHSALGRMQISKYRTTRNGVSTTARKVGLSNKDAFAQKKEDPMMTDVTVRDHCYLLDDAATWMDIACWKVKDVERHGAVRVDESKRCVKVEQPEMNEKSGNEIWLRHRETRM